MSDDVNNASSNESMSHDEDDEDGDDEDDDDGPSPHLTFSIMSDSDDGKFFFSI